GGFGCGPGGGQDRVLVGVGPLIDEAVGRIGGGAQVLGRVVPDLDLAPIAAVGDVDDGDVLFDLAAMALDQRPVGVGHLDDALGDDLGNHGHVAQAHGA